jgi:hypothetical protein
MLLMNKNIKFHILIIFIFLNNLVYSQTLEQKIFEIDQLRAGENTPFNEIDKRCNELLKEYLDPNDHGKIYFELVQVEGQSGFRRPEKILEFINKALSCPQEPLKKTRLYIYWGDAIQVANRGVHNQELIAARREAAMPYLLGLKETLKYNLPENKPDIISAGFLTFDGSPDSESFRKVKRLYDEKIVAEKLARFQRDMIEHRDILNSQIAGMYSRFPWASEEIKKLATEMLQDKTAVDRLMEQVDKGVQQRIKELGLEPQPPDNILPQKLITQKEDTNQKLSNEEIEKIIFIPDANAALKQGKDFVLDSLSSTLINPGMNIESEQAQNNLQKLGKGDIAWDDSIVTVRKAKALTIIDEAVRSLKYIPGKWCNHYKLPDAISLPYSFLLVTNEDINYLITIKKIETEGITISYKRLSDNEIDIYIKTEGNKKQ